MRILVISDTHGKTDRVFDVYKKLAAEAPIDMLVHCGDYYADAREIQARLGVPMVAVKGNCDGCFDFEAYSILETECGDILVAHGHMEDVGFSMQKLYYKALEQGCVGAFFGHTHRSVFVETGGVYLLNPGSLSLPRDGSGGTFALVVTSTDGLWGKIYRYDDFIRPTAAGSGSGIAALDSGAGSGSGTGFGLGSGIGAGVGAGSEVAPTTPNAPDGTASAVPKPKPKVKGGHLRSLINYSDRF